MARRHGISPSLLFRWIKDLKMATQEPAAIFLPVVLPTPAAPQAGPLTQSLKPCKMVSICADTIEIELANGRRVRVGRSVDGAALKRVIALLEE